MRNDRTGLGRSTGQLIPPSLEPTRPHRNPSRMRTPSRFPVPLFVAKKTAYQLIQSAKVSLT
jgi:hypothetical protein